MLVFFSFTVNFCKLGETIKTQVCETMPRAGAATAGLHFAHGAMAALINGFDRFSAPI
jgi:hypothetical protein